MTTPLRTTRGEATSASAWRDREPKPRITRTLEGSDLSPHPSTLVRFLCSKVMASFSRDLLDDARLSHVASPSSVRRGTARLAAIGLVLVVGIGAVGCGSSD